MPSPLVITSHRECQSHTFWTQTNSPSIHEKERSPGKDTLKAVQGAVAALRLDPGLPACVPNLPQYPVNPLAGGHRVVAALKGGSGVQIL